MGAKVVCNTALFTFVSLDRSGRPQKIPHLEPQTEGAKQRFEAGRMRYEAKKAMRATKKAD